MMFRCFNKISYRFEAILKGSDTQQTSRDSLVLWVFELLAGLQQTCYL